MRLTALCAAAGVAVTAFAATAPAEAAFNLIKWQGTGACQVWDTSVPTKPFPANYTTVSRPQKTFDAAIAVKAGLLKKGACKF
jgi:hypothetical protein